MALYAFEEHVPQVDPSAWVADNATVLGMVTIGAEASVWYGAVIRSDFAPIVIGRGSNVQDNAVLHADEGLPLNIGDNVTIGHQAMLHGCTIGAGSLIGIQAIVLNGARIGRNCLVGAGALVTEGKLFPDGSLIVGSPAQAVRALTAQQLERLQWSAAHYRTNAERHRRAIKPVA